MHTDCRHFTGTVPCAFHKIDRRSCDGCADYDRTARRILVIKLAAAGDVLRTTCILPALKSRWPSAQITWVTASNAVTLLDGNPLIDRIVDAEHAVPRLLVEEYDAGYGLDPDPDGAALMAIARCTERFGYSLDRSGNVIPLDAAARTWWELGLDDERKRANRRTYQSLIYDVCGLAGPIQRPQLAVPAAATTRIAQRVGVSRSQFARMLLLNVGGGSRWQEKRWRPEHYRAFVAIVRSREPETLVALVGGPDERTFSLPIRDAFEGADGVIDCGCDNTLDDFAALIEAADLVVTSDSLALHMATARQKPVVAIVGPTSPWELELYGRGEIVAADVPCLACYRRTCDKPVTCMDLVTPEDVYAACARVAPLALAEGTEDTGQDHTEERRNGELKFFPRFSVAPCDVVPLSP